MSHATLPLLCTPHFPQVLTQAISFYVNQIESRPTLGSCDYENEYVDCREKATVHHLGLEMEFCAEHFRKVVTRG